MIIEAVGRLVPGVLGNATSVEDESFADGLLEYPHYTRPAEFRGWGSPDVLRSGDHGKVLAGASPRRSNARRTTAPTCWTPVAVSAPTSSERSTSSGSIFPITEFETLWKSEPN